jgi:pimeloyl-ACP methyl ester carboxylesterase
MQMRASDRYFDLGDVRLRYRDDGRGDAVVFIHGWTLDLDTWEPQAEALAPSFRIIRFDRRGYGLSSGRPSLADDPGDALALLDHLGVRRSAIVGMSQGARVALNAALIAPHRISGLVLDGPPLLAADPETGADEDLPLEHYRDLMRTGGIEAFRKAWRLHPFLRLHSDDPRARELLTRVLSRHPGWDLMEGAAHSIAPFDARSANRLHTPALIINGELDTNGRKRAGESLLALLPHAERALLPNAGHLANLDNATAYNAVVREFLERQFRAAA